MKAKLLQESLCVAAAAHLMEAGPVTDKPVEFVLEPVPDPGVFLLPNRPDASGLSRGVRKKIARARRL